jgi:hypothetical protein
LTTTPPKPPAGGDPAKSDSGARRAAAASGDTAKSDSGATRRAAPAPLRAAQAQQPQAEAPLPPWRQALAKVTMLDVVIALLAIGLAASFILPSMAAAERASNEQAALAFMRQVPDLENIFRNRSEAKRFATSFKDLAIAGLLDGPPPEGSALTRDGYVFRLGVLGDGSERFFGLAVPERFGDTGDRSFYVDEMGVVHEGPGPIAGPAFPEAK